MTDKEMLELKRDAETAKEFGEALASDMFMQVSPDAVISLIAEVESLRKQLDESQKEYVSAAMACGGAVQELHELRASHDADIERAVRLTIDELTILSPNVYAPGILAKLKIVPDMGRDET